MEAVLFVYLPWLIIAAVLERTRTGAKDRRFLACLGIWCGGLLLCGAIFLFSRGAAEIVFPLGNAAFKSAVTEVERLSGDYSTVNILMPEDFASLAGAVREYRAGSIAPLTLETLETMKPRGSELVGLMWARLSRADDGALLDMWRKSLDLDRELRRDDVAVCASRSGWAMKPFADGRTRSATHDLFRSAVVAAFFAGKTAGRTSLPEIEGMSLLKEASVGTLSTDDLDLRFSRSAAADPVRQCDLRIRFAEVALASPRAAEIIRFVYAWGYQ